MKKYLEKIDQKQLRLVFAVIIVIVLFCAYQFGYVNYTDKTKTIEDNIIILEQQNSDLSAQVAQEQTYRDSIVVCQDKMKAIMDQFGPRNTPEKSTKFLIDLSKKTGIQIPTVTFSPEEQIFESTSIPTSDGFGVYAYHNTLSITYNTSYEGLKESVDYINNNFEKMNIQSLSASYDSETGNLSGSMVINLYAMTGTGKTYEPPVIDGVSIGNTSIFGTVR